VIEGAQTRSRITRVGHPHRELCAKRALEGPREGARLDRGLSASALRDAIFVDNLVPISVQNVLPALFVAVARILKVSVGPVIHFLCCLVGVVGVLALKHGVFG